MTEIVESSLDTLVEIAWYTVKVLALMALMQSATAIALAQTKQKPHVPSGATMPNCRGPENSLISDAAKKLTLQERAQLQVLINRLEKDLHHQLGVYTVGTLKSTGFATPHDLANALGRKCEIGFAWADTWVIILSTEAERWTDGKVLKPAEIWAETSRTEAYLTDWELTIFIDDAKKACKNWDIACIIQRVGESIEARIRKEFDTKWIAWLKDITRQLTIEKIKHYWMIALLVIGGIIILVYIRRRRKRKNREASGYTASDAIGDVIIYSPGPWRAPINQTWGGGSWSGAWAWASVEVSEIVPWADSNILYDAAASLSQLWVDALMWIPEVAVLLGEGATAVAQNVDGETVINIIWEGGKLLWHVIGWIFTAIE